MALWGRKMKAKYKHRKESVRGGRCRSRREIIAYPFQAHLAYIAYIPPWSLPIFNLSTQKAFSISHNLFSFVYLFLFFGFLSNKIKFYCCKMLREIVAGYKLLMCPRYRTATPPSLLHCLLPCCGWFGLLCWLFNLFKFKFVCLSLSLSLAHRVVRFYL